MDNINGNNVYSAEDAQIYTCTRTSGVYSTDDDFITSISGDMEVSVSTGIMWMKYDKFKGVSICNKEPYKIKIDIGDGNLSRIDSIIVRLDITVQTPYFYYKKGSTSISPAPPELIRNKNYWDIEIARVEVKRGAITLNQGNIIDMRMDETSCGIMRDGVTKIPTQTLFDTWYQWFDNLKSDAEREAEGLSDWIAVFKASKNNEFSDFIDSKNIQFSNWFESIKNQLSEDAAGNLQVQIDDLPIKKVSFRYMRDCLNGDSQVPNYSYWISGEIWAKGENIASGLIPIASTTYTGELSSYTNGDNSAVDRNRVRMSASEGWQYLELDLGEIRRDIDYINICHTHNKSIPRYSNHKLLVSDDGTTWYTLFDSDQQGAYIETEKGRTHYLNDSYVENELSKKADLSMYFHDTGWIDLEPLNGFRINMLTYPFFRIRRIGNTVVIDGSLLVPLNGSWDGKDFVTIAELPSDCLPIIEYDFLTQGHNESTDVFKVSIDGYLSIGKHLNGGNYIKPSSGVASFLKGLSYTTEYNQASL